jgi:tetratricopeptide (TPR) repeat protein
MTATTPTTHLWLVGTSALHTWLEGTARPTFGVHEGHARGRGAYTAAGALMRMVVPELLEQHAALVQRYDIEVLAAAPELAGLVTNQRTTLTSEADPQTRTRYYPHNRMAWIGNGLADLTLAAADLRGPGQTLVVTDADQLDATDNAWLAGLVRRADPQWLQVVLTTRGQAVSEPLATELAAHSERRPSATDELPARTELSAPADAVAGARAYVQGLCLSPGEDLRAAYRNLPEDARARLHDEEADRLVALGEESLTRGAIPFHREHGSDRALAARTLSAAMADALMAGFYDQVVELGSRVRALVPWDDDAETCWLATVKMTIAYQAMGMPDEAMELFDDACANSTLPSVHMQSAYGRAMVYTRYYDEPRRDLRRAKGLINTAVVLAGLSTDDQRRAYNRTFNENGLALIDMHLGNVDEAVALIESGIARLDREVEGGRFLLHRSVLRYNHAQLMVRTGQIERAVQEYTHVLAEDPHHPDYWFERAALFERLGRHEEAIADYSEAIRVSPPYPEPIYNRGDLRMRTDDVEGALQDFSRVIDLDPTFVDAYVNKASLLLELGDLDAAERAVEDGLALEPQHPHLLSLKGVLRQEAGHLEAAREALVAATTVAPDLAVAWANLGAVLFDLGDVSGCITCLEKSLALTDDEDVRENLEVARSAA